ncbi:MAG: T9SS type A sorting domain-containing protein [Bacteroidales bacterium]
MFTPLLKYALPLVMIFYAGVTLTAQTDDFVYQVYPELSRMSYIQKTTDDFLIMMNWSQVMKTDLQGNPQWVFTLNQSGDSGLRDLHVSDDGSVWLAAGMELESGHFGAANYPGMLRLSAQGDSIAFYSPFVNSPDTSDLFVSASVDGIAETQSGDFVLTGSVRDSLSDHRLLVFEMNQAGETQWMFADTIDNDMFMYNGEDVLQAENGNVYITGGAYYRGPSIDNPRNNLVAGFTADGDTLFTRLFPENTITSAYEYGMDLINLDDALLCMSIEGGMYTTNHNIIYRKLSYDGTLEETHVLGQDVENWEFNYLQALNFSRIGDGGFISPAVIVNKPVYQNMSLIARYDANLNLSWLRLVGDTLVENSGLEVLDAVELNDGRLAFTGQNVDNQAFLLITSPTGAGDYSNELIMDVEPEQQSEFTVYPNPVRNHVLVSTDRPAESVRFSLFDMHGRMLRQWDVTGEKELDVSGLQDGVYILKSRYFLPQKIVIQG